MHKMVPCLKEASTIDPGIDPRVLFASVPLGLSPAGSLFYEMMPRYMVMSSAEN